MAKTYLKSINESLHSITIEDVNYEVNNGLIEVSNEHVDRLLPHGFIIHIPEVIEQEVEVVTPVKKARVKK